MLFPVYMVIEHYVAVVHPMTYLSLKTGRGRLIRNISTGLAWVCDNMTNTSVTFDVILRVQASIFSLVVILPLCVYVLHLGFKQWKSKKHDPSWFVNYSDFFAYNVAVMELVGCAGYFALLFIIFYDYEKSMVFYELGSFAWYGQFLFPVFTVLEHYVAVVHPMTYVSLKKGRGILIRNICSGLVWVISSVLFYIATQTGFESAPAAALSAANREDQAMLEKT
uniref:Uncharacterized protein n=1 Tax=Knipowitschia caucasica TaxID=637954 RepID=A0AAV2KSA6_KNICA